MEFVIQIFIFYIFSFRFFPKDYIKQSSYYMLAESHFKECNATEFTQHVYLFHLLFFNYANLSLAQYYVSCFFCII